MWSNTVNPNPIFKKRKKKFKVGMMGRKRGQIRFGKYYDFHGNEKFDAQAQTCI